MTLIKNLDLNRMLNRNAFRRLLQVRLSANKKIKLPSAITSCFKRMQQAFYYHRESEDYQLQIVEKKKNAVLISSYPPPF